MKKIIIFSAIFFLSLLNFSNSQALENKKLEDKISKNLRCLVCQGQSIYESQSDFAISVKLLINEKIKEGQSEKEIYEFFEMKYGEWILFEPKFNMKTIVLWGFPILLFIFAGLLIIRKLIIN